MPVDDPEVVETMSVDLEAMYAEALAMLPQLWRKAVHEGRDPLQMVLDLTDNNGTLLLSVPFADLVREADRVH